MTGPSVDTLESVLLSGELRIEVGVISPLQLPLERFDVACFYGPGIVYELFTIDSGN